MLFVNLVARFYTVYVHDQKGCCISEEEITIIGFSKLFTPYGDGSHENWQIIGADEGLPTATVTVTVTIYDKYGTLLNQFDTSDNGWDGTLNVGQLPASDYWFMVGFLDEKQFKGRFSLKR